MAQMQKTASRIEGQFTGTIHTDDADPKAAQCLLPLIERETSRFLANGFPTRVEATDAMVHAGPYPASTNFGATAVGTPSIRPFPRPACCQDLDTALLPVVFDTEKAKNISQARIFVDLHTIIVLYIKPVSAGAWERHV